MTSEPKLGTGTLRRLIFGAGYLGLRAARRWRLAGDHLFAVTRSHQRADNFQRQGLAPIVADVTRPETLAALPEADTVLFAVAPDTEHRTRASELYEGGLQNVLAALPRSVQRLVFISTTGVYGPAGGDWVNEDSPCQPQRESGRACMAAERLLWAGPVADRAVVLRLAGIYGPDRLPRRRELLSGEPIAAPDSGWLNLIHVEDAVEAVLLAASAPDAAGRTYVVSDGHPVDRGEYLRELARQIGAPEPRFAAPVAASPAAIRAADNKRIDSARIRRELGFQPRYPDYRTGLAAILAGEA